MKLLSVNPATLKEMFDLVKGESQNAIEDYKKSAPAFKEELEKLFSLKLDLETTNARLVHLVLEYARTPLKSLKIVPSIMDTLKNLETGRDNYKRSMNFPDLYPYSLKQIRKQNKDNKHILNKQIWLLILYAGLTTRSERSIWYSLSELYGDKSPGGPM